MVFMMMMMMTLTEFKWCLSAWGQRWGIRAGRAALARLPVFPAFDRVFVLVSRIWFYLTIRARVASFILLFWALNSLSSFSLN